MDRDEVHSPQDAAVWLYSYKERGWWETEPNEVYHAGIILLNLRRRVEQRGYGPTDNE
jgi:hypothetical protein